MHTLPVLLRRLLASCGAALLLLSAGCAVNPATGEKQIALMSEGQEIQLGRSTAGQVSRSMSRYPDEELNAYVAALGAQLAAVSERPALPWTFSVVDDDAINAFALPGGFIYVTRGIMAYFNSEAELAAVLGHEIGHVTARHSVERYSRQQLAQLGLGIGGALFEPIRGMQGALGSGLGLLFLKYGRDDERQADALGLRYMMREGYAPDAALATFEMLRRQGESASSAAPGWLSTHPTPQDRIVRLRQQIEALGVDGSAGKVRRADYLARIDGMVFGNDPRHGYFDGGTFNHPDMRFRLVFPDGWQTRNLATAVQGAHPQGRAMLQLTPAPGAGHRNAAVAFFGGQNIQADSVQQTRINGKPATVGRFAATASNGGTVMGIAAMIEHGETTLQLTGFTDARSYNAFEPVFMRYIGSFETLTDRRALNVQPQRLDLVRLPRAQSIRGLLRSRPSALDADALALLNGVAADETLPAGHTLKWVSASAR